MDELADMEQEGVDAVVAVELPELLRLHAAYGLRGADSLHLAAALFYQRQAGEKITFACADTALAAAAKAEGIDVGP